MVDPTRDVKHMGRPSNAGQVTVPRTWQLESQTAMTIAVPAPR